MRDCRPAATEMASASGEMRSAAASAAKVSATTVSATEVTAAAVAAAAMSTTAVTAPASAGCINRAGQRDRQHNDRQPFDVDIRHDISSSGSGADLITLPMFERRAAAQLGHVSCHNAGAISGVPSM